MLTQIDKLGSIGLNADLAPWQLAPNAWTSLNNMRCNDGQIDTFAGHEDFVTPSIVPYYLMPTVAGSAYYWIYPGLDKVYAWNGSANTNITRQTDSSDVDYTGSAANRWNGCMINGIPVLNNGVDDPQMWTPVATNTNLQIITDWDTNWKAKVVRSYKDFLFAFDVTKSGTNHPYMVKWSASGAGAMPTDWDEASTTNDAGETSLGDTVGGLVDAMPLRDAFIIYKEDSVFGCQYTGGQFVHRFYRISGLIGALAQDCMAELPGGRHFVVGNGDVYVHDGQSGVSVIDQQNRDYLFDSIDADNYLNTYVVLHQSKSEIWICYPENGKTFPNKALIWNYQDKTWSSRNLPNETAFISPGVIVTGAMTWDTIPYATWDDWPGAWGTRSYSPVASSLVGATTDTKLYQFEDGNQFDSVNAYCSAERIGLDIGDSSDVHTINAIYPHIEGGAVDIYVGSQMHVNDSVSWEGPYSFNPSTDRKIDCRVTGILHAIRFESTANAGWAITDYGVDFRRAGGR